MDKTKKIHIVFQVLNFLHSDHHLARITTPAEHLVLINLASHKGKKGIFPSISKIVKEIKVNKRTIIRAIQKWEQLEVIAIQKNTGKENQYFLSIPCATGDIPDTSEKNVTGDIPDTGLVTFTTSTGDIYDPIYNKEVTKELTKKSFYTQNRKAENEKQHPFADSMNQMANEQKSIEEHQKRKQEEKGTPMPQSLRDLIQRMKLGG